MLKLKKQRKSMEKESNLTLFLRGKSLKNWKNDKKTHWKINIWIFKKLKKKIYFPVNFPVLAYLTVVLREIWNISEIEKMKNCSKIQFYMGKMNFWSKCAYVSWLLRYSVFSILTKISWQTFLPKLQKNWAWLNISESTCGFAFIRRFQKWYKFWKLIIQQLTYEQFAV